MTAHLIDFASRLNVTRTAHRLENYNRSYDSSARRYGRKIDPAAKAIWLKNAPAASARRWFLEDNFPVGRMFKFLGVDCQSLGVVSEFGESFVQYLAKGEKGGLVERRLPFDCAFALICEA